MVQRIVAKNQLGMLKSEITDYLKTESSNVALIMLSTFAKTLERTREINGSNF